jgi:hypothetical protein
MNIKKLIKKTLAPGLKALGFTPVVYRKHRRSRFRLPDELATFSGHRATRAQVDDFLKRLEDLKRNHANTPSHDVCYEVCSERANIAVSEYAFATGNLAHYVVFDADIVVELPPRQHFKLLAALSEAGLNVREGWYREMSETWRSDIPVRLSVSQLVTLDDVLGKFTDDARVSMVFGGFKLPK